MHNFHSNVVKFLRPERVLIFVTIFSVLGAGISLNGRFLLDEIIWLLSIILIFSLHWKQIFSWKNILILKTRTNIFLYVFLGYLFLQSLRTLAFQPTVTSFSYVVHAGLLLLGTLCFGLLFVNLEKSARLKIQNVLLWSVVFYNFLYLLQGFSYENFIHATGQENDIPARYLTQGIYWSGSAYAAIPSLIALIVACQSKQISGVCFGFLTATIAAIAIYYDSRLALALFGLSLMIVFSKWEMRLQNKFYIIGFLAIIGVAAYHNSASVKKVVTSASSGVLVLVDPHIDRNFHEGDYDRYAHFYAGFRAIKDTSVTALIGHGHMMHREKIGNQIAKIFYEHDLCKQSLEECVSVLGISKHEMELILKDQFHITGKRTTTFSATTTDLGIAGIVLLYLAIFNAWFISSKAIGWNADGLIQQSLLVFCFGLVSIWPILIFINDVSLFWLLLLPTFTFGQSFENSALET